MRVTRVAKAIALGLDDEAIVKQVEKDLLAVYSDHTVPGGQPNMVELSVRGLIAELRGKSIVRSSDTNGFAK